MEDRAEKLRNECRDLQRQLYESRIRCQVLEQVSQAHEANMLYLNSVIRSSHAKLEQLLKEQDNVTNAEYEIIKCEFLRGFQNQLRHILLVDMEGLRRRYPELKATAASGSALTKSITEICDVLLSSIKNTKEMEARVNKGIEELTDREKKTQELISVIKNLEQKIKHAQELRNTGELNSPSDLADTLNGSRIS